MTVKIAEVTFDGGISWRDHVCKSPPPSVLTSGPAQLLAGGFGAIAAGASLYNAFQLRELKRVAQRIDLNVQELLAGMAHVAQLAEAIDRKTDALVAAECVRTYVQEPLRHFEGSVARRDVSTRAISTLAADLETGWRELTRLLYRPPSSRSGVWSEEEVRLARNRVGPPYPMDQMRRAVEQMRDEQDRHANADVPLSATLSEQIQSAFCCFRLLNMLVVQAHNDAVGGSPTQSRRYLDLEQPWLVSDSGEWSDLVRMHQQYRGIEPHKPKTKLLAALVLESRQAELHLRTSAPLQSGRVVYLPSAT